MSDNEKKKDNILGKAKKGFGFGEKGPREKKMDRETAIALLRACGYPTPQTEEEWKKYVEEMSNLLKSLSEEQRASLVRASRRVAKDRVRVSDLMKREITEKDLQSVNEYIILREGREDKGIDVLEDYSSYTEEQRAVVVEGMISGLAGQEKALQHLENEFEKTPGQGKTTRVAIQAEVKSKAENTTKEDKKRGFEIDL